MRECPLASRARSFGRRSRAIGALLGVAVGTWPRSEARGAGLCRLPMRRRLSAAFRVGGCADEGGVLTLIKSWFA